MTEPKTNVAKIDNQPAGGFTLDELFTDPNKDENGVWVEFFGGSRLKIASIESPKYKAHLARVVKANKLRLDDDNDDALPLVRRLTAEAMSKHVLLDWENINLNGETDVPYTPERGFMALQHSSKFRDFVAEAAADHSNFKAGTVDQVKKP